MAPSTTATELRRAIEDRQWYHTLELGNGLLTPGWFDHRPIVGELPLPASLAGKRCLDVGTFDGFWAFEMERRGAAEVVAVDVPDAQDWDWPAFSEDQVRAVLAERKRGGDGFRLAHDALGSRVEHRAVSVYDLDPAQLGSFEFVYLGSLLIHLRDPVRALERVRAVCSGELLLVDNHEPLLTRLFPRLPLARLDARGRPWWWQSNVACVVRIVESAGFELIGAPRRLSIPAGAGQPAPPLRRQTLMNAEGRRALRNVRLGDPHVAIRARPRR
jgi:tRNA (mo5U34)-methyltransferase